MTVASILCLGRAIAAAPVNDHLVNAQPLIGTYVAASGTNLGATREVGEPNHGFPGGKSVWWTWTAPGSGSLLVETTGSTFDTVLAAYTGVSYAVMTLVASNDDKGSLETSKIAFNVAAGVTYQIAVDGFNGAAGEIQLVAAYREKPLVKPANDEFGAPASLAGPFVSLSSTTFLASKEADEPRHAGDPGGASVWWRWTAPGKGSATINTRGSTFDTLLAVYTGSALTNLTVIASNDDICSNQPTSSVTFDAIEATVYLIAVDGFNGEPGDLELHISMEDFFRFMSPVRLSEGRWKLAIASVPGVPCEIQASEDLITWSTTATLTSPTGRLEFTEPDTENVPCRFYRARRMAESGSLDWQGWPAVPTWQERRMRGSVAGPKP